METASINLTVKFFASLREQLGIESRELSATPPLSVSEVWEQVTEQQPPENLLCSRNRKYAEWNEQVENGDEVAFFPPVTGG